MAPDGREVDAGSSLVKTATEPPGAAPLSREKRDITTQGSDDDPTLRRKHDCRSILHAI